jgi:hypothetical protein
MNGSYLCCKGEMKEAAMKNCREPENVRAFDLRRIEEI